jgi:hypothetical protein
LAADPGCRERERPVILGGVAKTASIIGGNAQTIESAIAGRPYQ